MPPKSLKTLEDIRDAAEYIFEIAAQETLKSYRKNRMLRQAVERNFEIIGKRCAICANTTRLLRVT